MRFLINGTGLGGAGVLGERRVRFATYWILACAIPALVSYADRDPQFSGWPFWWLIPAALALAILQGLTLRRFVSRGVFWAWFWATAPLVAAAPWIGYIAGFAWYLLLAVIVTALGGAGFVFSGDASWIFLTVYLAGLVAGGAPAVLVQAIALRGLASRRWLMTLPVPGLTFGIAALLFPTPSVSAEALVLVRIALAAVYGVLTSIALLPLVSSAAPSSGQMPRPDAASTTA